jgi:hypothetical protein
MLFSLANGADCDVEVFCAKCLENRHGSVEYSFGFHGFAEMSLAFTAKPTQPSGAVEVLFDAGCRGTTT